MMAEASSDQAEQLESQTADSFLGALVLVRLSDGSEEFLRVPFPASTSTLSRREGLYAASHSDRTVATATVMLGCYGYAGVAHFTDVRLAPLVEPAAAGHACRARDLLEDCPTSTARSLPSTHRRQKLKFELILGKVRASSSKKRHLNKDVALVTQLSMDRLPVLEHTLQLWEGPVSLVIYVPLKGGKVDGDWQKLYVQKKLQNLKLHPDSHVSLAYGVSGSGDYPINALRNAAIKQTNCEYLLTADADFQPSPDFHKHFLLSTRRCLRRLCETPQGGTLRREEGESDPESHQSTDYWKWYRTDKPYVVQTFSDKYEPYLVLKNTAQLPPYDERFTGYGMNKITHVTELFAAGYVFLVLPHVWLVHVPHKPSSYFADHVQNPQHRLRNRVQRFEFLVDVMRKYKLGRCR
ncbi:hypothetical protein HPB51_011801 [Rhipicephalus microplus]|uniref:Uncharacterized protein n=1 Tax=Rhipicephalus microplus TaxID=6941 RepID=A0A9J6DGK3_RHIMP|nr:hypothetical protein HPB51_011801 [Rhipicephalus microplus]